MKLIHRLAALLKLALHTLSPNCRDASRLQAEALDRPLPMMARLGLRVHLALCGWCRRYGRHLRFLRRAAQTLREEVVDTKLTALSPAGRDRVKRAILDHDQRC